MNARKITVDISQTNYSRLVAKTHTWADVLRLEGKNIETVIDGDGSVMVGVRASNGLVRPVSDYVIGKVRKRGFETKRLNTVQNGRKDTIVTNDRNANIRKQGYEGRSGRPSLGKVTKVAPQIRRTLPSLETCDRIIRDIRSRQLTDDHMDIVRYKHGMDAWSIMMKNKSPQVRALLKKQQKNS